MNFPEDKNENNQSENNQNQKNQSRNDQNQDERDEEMNDQEQSQTSEGPSEFSGVAHASMEGTTEQDALVQAYDAARPSYELESDEHNENDDQ